MDEEAAKEVLRLPIMLLERADRMEIIAVDFFFSLFFASRSIVGRFLLQVRCEFWIVHFPEGAKIASFYGEDTLQVIFFEHKFLEIFTYASISKLRMNLASNYRSVVPKEFVKCL